ncbi:MAG: large-conductance mechanosensitive channel protein MscL [Firmicutes bacterium]|nr:large-conductance mechanosensitive channel protein MscL [Bacillota bacterium]
MIKEFKEFISRGSVIDLAVGIIVGGAFTSIVTSFVNDIIMPVLGLILGKINFKDLKLVLVKATEDVSEVSINYGNFIQNIINFLLTALAIFIMIKFINKFKHKEKKKEEVKPVKSDEVILLTEIRDLLKK